MNILNALKQLRDDIKTWVANNLNALNAKIDEKTIPIDSELSSTSTNPVQNQAIAKEIDSINDRVGDTPVAIQISNAIDNIPTFSGDYNDLTNAPDISEDGSGNMVITDESGNIIFKADADGIHTTAVSLNGEAAASEKYVDEAIAAIPKTDLTGYATEDYVDEAIDAIPETDLTDYYTKSETETVINTAKAELSESIVAESDEWKVVDEAGNIIFSVDADGAHTTSMSLNGESVATESYVEESIAKIDFPETDLTGYATEEYVTNAVNSIEIPEVDFTGYATEEYVGNAIDSIVFPETDLSNYYNKLETDAAIEATKNELSESIVAESEEWKVVDEAGNIIFSVDADGAHATALSLNGESVEDIIDERVAALVDSAPDTLNTLNELAAALGDNPNFAATVTTEIGKKVDKVDGKGLSTNDFTDEYKEKLDGIGTGGVEESDPTVPAWAKEPNKPTYTAEEVGALSESATLADLTDDADHRTVTDAEKSTWDAKSDFSGDYNDLENAPNIVEDDAGNLVIADADGNVIFRSDSDGFETTKLTTNELILNGQTIDDMINVKIESYVDEAILGGAW